MAFVRWRQGEFFELERTYAAGLRQSLAEVDLRKVASSLQSLGINNTSVRSVEEAKSLADILVAGHQKRAERLYVALQVLNIPDETGYRILRRWEAAGRPALTAFAPYAAYVLTVELFFHIAIGAKLIGAARQSNRTDIAYFYYLTFGYAFVSSDRLHQQCVSAFLRSDQKFLWGPEIKAAMKRLNAHYSELPEIEREKGIMTFARRPPLEGDCLTATLYDSFNPGWRNEIPEPCLSADAQNEIVERMNAFSDSTERAPPGLPVREDDIRSLSVPHLVRKRKGSWWQLPKDLQVSPEHRTPLR